MFTILVVSPFIDSLSLRREHWYVYLNIQMSVFVLLTIKVCYLMLFIELTGPLMRMIFHMSTIILAFTFGSATIIFVISCAVHTLSIRYDTKNNDFKDVWTGVLVLYEFTFGSVGYIRGDEEAGAGAEKWPADAGGAKRR